MKRYKRTIGIRTPKQRFLIVCEGEKTEPNYFKAFRVLSADVKTEGYGYNTNSLVKKAIELRDKAKREGDVYNQVWCVFDKNSFPPENFNKAFKIAKENNIKIAYSNEAFELWYLLHFNYMHSAITRKQYNKKLTKLLSFTYYKNNDEMYEILLDKQKDAIKNAQKLLQAYNSFDPSNNNPSTTVHTLVEELNKFI